MHTSQLGSLISVDFSPEMITPSALGLGDASINIGLVDIIFSVLPFYLFAAIFIIAYFIWCHRKVIDLRLLTHYSRSALS